MDYPGEETQIHTPGEEEETHTGAHGRGRTGAIRRADTSAQPRMITRGCASPVERPAGFGTGGALLSILRRFAGISYCNSKQRSLDSGCMKHLTNSLMSEITTLGGIPLTRADVYRILKADGFDARCIDYFAFGRPAIPCERPYTVDEYRAFIAEPAERS